MNTLLHHAPCERDRLQLAPELHMLLQVHTDTTYHITIYEQCIECRAAIYYVGQAAVRGSNVIRAFRREATAWIATWLHRNTLWGDQPLTGLS